MRFASVILLVASTAAAEPGDTEMRDVTVAAGGETIGSAQNTTAKASAGYERTTPYTRMIGTSRGSASGELRAGSDVEVAGKAEAALDLSYDLGLAPDGKRARESVAALWGDASLAMRPGLDAPRDVARGVFAGYGGGGRLTIVPTQGTTKRGLFRTFVGGGAVIQGDAKRVTSDFGFDVYFHCEMYGCLHVLEVAWHGVTGGDKEAVIATTDFIKVTGVGTGAVRGELALGVLTNNAVVGNEVREIQTEDLPTITVPTWNAGLATRLGPLVLDARTARTGYISLDGDMSVEDRGALAVSTKLRSLTLTAKSFAARTQWWTSKMDPGQRALTGGGELGATYPLAGFELAGALGIARSFYPVLDEAAVDRPATGMRASVGATRRFDL